MQYFRFAKSEIRTREQDKLAADRARERHEYREFRIEREKQEKADRLAAKEKAAAKPVEPPVVATNPDAAPENTAQMKIQAAIEHAKEQAAAIKPKNTENLSAEQLAEIAEIEARRARIRELAKSDVEPPKE